MFNPSRIKNNWCKCCMCQGLHMRNCHDVWRVFYFLLELSEESCCSTNIKTDSQHLESLWNNREKHSVSYTDRWHFTPQPRVRSGIITCTHISLLASIQTNHYAEILYITAWTLTKKEQVSEDGTIVGTPVSGHCPNQPKIKYIVCLRGVHKRSPWAQVPLQMSRWSFGTLDLQLLMGHIRNQ